MSKTDGTRDVVSKDSIWNPNIDPAEVDAASDAMRAIWESEECRSRGGVSWRYLAQSALEAAEQVRIKNTHRPWRSVQ